MELKDKKYFYFTQNSLSTFVKCPFRFKKKYIDNVKWQQEENEFATEHIEFGTDFHKIAERYFKKISIYEESFADKESLYNAYKNLNKTFPLNDKEQYFPEYTIRFSDNFMRLEANIDLIVIKEDKSIEIWDWKTNANIKNAQKYANSLQTSVYMWALKKCAKDIFGVELDTQKLKMIYFSPEQNSKISEIAYSDKLYKKDEESLKSLIEKVYNYNYDTFNREEYIKQCKFCEFETFCSNQKSCEIKDFRQWNLDMLEEVF